MSLKLSNIKNAAASTVMGLLILVIGTISTSIASGHFSLTGLVSSLVPALLLSITDILNEVKKELDAPADTPSPAAEEKH